MAHYAFVDENGYVSNVIVGFDEDHEGVDWEQEYGAIRTSYNTRGGVHYDPETGNPSDDQSKAFRYNYAGIGMRWDPEFGPDGAFYWPQPYPSWTLNPASAEWEAPVPHPADGKMYNWDEATVSWLEFDPSAE